MRLTRVARCVWTDGVALLTIILAGVVSSLLFHVPAALTLVQIIALELFILAYPIYTLPHDKPHHKLTHLEEKQMQFEIAAFGVLAAALAYANYLYFFARQNIGPAYIDTRNPLYEQAATTAVLTLGLCQLLNLLFVRADGHKKSFYKQLKSNKKLVVGLGISLFVALNLVYNPLLQALFATNSLSVIDWLTVIAAGAVYTGLRLLQRHTRQHSRHSVIKLHREVHGT